jgi:hypothetical protein
MFSCFEMQNGDVCGRCDSAVIIPVHPKRVIPRVISLIVGQPLDVPKKHAVGFRASLSFPTMSHTTPCESVGYMSPVKPASATHRAPMTPGDTVRLAAPLNLLKRVVLAIAGVLVQACRW